MLHVFSTNRVKLVARTPKTTIKKGQREYILCYLRKLLICICIFAFKIACGSFEKITLCKCAGKAWFQNGILGR